MSFYLQVQSINLAYIPLILPILQKAIFCPNRQSDRFLYNRVYLGIVLSYEKGFYDMGVAYKLSLPRPFFWKITYSSKKGVATLIYTPRPFPFRFTQRDTRAIISESFIKLSSPILKCQKFEFWILKKTPILLVKWVLFSKSKIQISVI